MCIRDSGNPFYKVRSILLTERGTLIVITQKNVYLYDEKNNKFTVALHEQEIFKTEDIVDIKEDKSSNIWVGTTKSLIKVDRNTKEIIQYYSDDSGSIIKDDKINSILIDKENNIWVSTSNNGCLLYTSGNNTAEIREAVSLSETIRALLPSNIVSSMAEGNIVGVVIFSAFIGTSIRRLSKKHADTIEPFVRWVEAFYKIIISVTMTIIKFMPYAVIALLANTIISNGIGVLASVGKFIVCLYLAVIIMLVVHMTLAKMCIRDRNTSKCRCYSIKCRNYA